MCLIIFISIAVSKLITVDVHAQDERRAGLFDEHRQSIEQLSTEAQDRISQLKEREIAAEARQVTLVSDLHRKNELAFRFNTESKKLLPAHSGAGIELMAIKENLEIISDNEYAWTGTVVNPDDHEKIAGRISLIHRNEGEITGNLRIGSRHFMIRHMGNQQHILINVKPSGERDADYKEPMFEKSNNPSNRRKDSEKNNSLSENLDHVEPMSGPIGCGSPFEVNLLVAYTEAANSGDISGDISLARQQANNALSNSEVNNLNYSVVHQQEVNFDESTNIDLDRNRIVSDNQLNNLREEHNADMVVLITDAGYTINGIEILGAVATIYAEEADSAFAIVERDFLADERHTFAHELGHLHGAEHHPDDQTSVDPEFDFGFGHRFVDSAPWYCPIFCSDDHYSTVMAYETAPLEFDTYSTVEHFSNPNVSYSGESTGTGSRNNAQVMQNTASHISGFFPDQLQADINVVSYNPPNATLEADACGGEDSYSYEWRVSYGDPGNFGPVESTDATFNMTLMTGHNYAKLTVSDGTSVTNAYYSTYVHQEDCDDPMEPCIEDIETPLTESQPDESKPDRFNLHSVYPNPFNPVTNLSFDLPEESQVSLAVYDLLGRQVQQIASGTKQAGTHTYSFDASDLPSGTYIVRMAGDGFEETMNITLVK